MSDIDYVCVMELFPQGLIITVCTLVRYFSDAVPPEVREWLASTFTRQLVTTRKRTEEKPKFRTVAHAIRAGIFVDRIYRRVSSTAMLQFPPEVVKVLKVNCKKIAS